MDFICLDLEGVLIPEIWISVAERTGIEALRATTRDIPDYRQLMDQRLKILDRHGLAIADIQKVIGALAPLAGAAGFLEALRARYQVVILSDTFYEFAAPLMRQLKLPTLLCHRLEIAGDGRIAGYRLRMADHKRHAVRAFKSLNFHVMAAGDSYNDTSMLIEADRGFLFRPPENVIAEFPQFPVLTEYGELLAAFDEAAST
jgi:phosphoserine/homoserine phosphotransferase